MIAYPVKAEMKSGSLFAVIRDSTDRVIAGAMAPDDAEEITERLNATARRAPARKRKRDTAAELEASDVGALLADATTSNMALTILCLSVGNM